MPPPKRQACGIGACQGAWRTASLWPLRRPLSERLGRWATLPMMGVPSQIAPMTYHKYGNQTWLAGKNPIDEREGEMFLYIYMLYIYIIHIFPHFILYISHFIDIYRGSPVAMLEGKFVVFFRFIIYLMRGPGRIHGRSACLRCLAIRRGPSRQGPVWGCLGNVHSGMNKHRMILANPIISHS